MPNVKEIIDNVQGGVNKKEEELIKRHLVSDSEKN